MCYNFGTYYDNIENSKKVSKEGKKDEALKGKDTQGGQRKAR